MHAEDHPDLVATIKTAQEGQAAQDEAAHQEWLAARADGSVERMKGEVDVKKIIPNQNDNDIEALRKLRLAQMKGRAQARQEWLKRGHGQYADLSRRLCEELPKHERVVCSLPKARSMQTSCTLMKRLCHVPGAYFGYPPSRRR